MVARALVVLQLWLGALALTVGCPSGPSDPDGGGAAQDGGSGGADAGRGDAGPRATQICSENQTNLEDHYCWIMIRACETNGPTTYYWLDCELDVEPTSCDCKVGDSADEGAAELVQSFTPEQDLCAMGGERVDVINSQCGWSLVPQ